MGPLEGIGPYAETTITTRKSDVDGATDNKPHMGHFVLGLLLIVPALCVAWFMGLFVLAYIGLIVPAGIIGLAIWACGHYGTNKSIFDRFRYRMTAAQKNRITQRLSDTKRF